jgi:hypothetical protein
MRVRDLTGQRFGRWLVLEIAGRSAERGAVWSCVCDCGVKRAVAAKAMVAGDSQSCGCLGKERRLEGVRRAKTTHGHTVGDNSRTYRIWINMVSRCTNPKFDSFPWYGGRGIKVCDRWRKFQYFLDDMGVAPDEMTIDRRDSNGDYEPENCRWATRTEQANNTRRNRILEWNGRTYTQAQLAREVGVDQRRISERLNSGWSVERAVQKVAA